MASARQFGHFVLFGITVLLIVYVAYIGIRNVFRYNKFKLDYEAAFTQLEYEQRRNERLKLQIERLADPSYWEFKAKQIGYVSKGEFVYKLKPRKVSE